MTAEHFHPPRPAQFAGWALPIPNLTCSVRGQEATVLDFFSNAVSHQKIRVTTNSNWRLLDVVPLVSQFQLQEPMPAHFQHDKSVAEDLCHLCRTINAFLVVDGQVKNLEVQLCGAK